jgi:hypothetical protein
MRRIAVTLAIACCAFGASAQTCEYPAGVNVPDGKTASKEEMVAGQQQVKSYMAAMQEYLDCLDAETSASGEEPTDEERKIMVSRHNAAVDEMETLAASFNEQVRRYKKANSD